MKILLSHFEVNDLVPFENKTSDFQMEIRRSTTRKDTLPEMNEFSQNKGPFAKTRIVFQPSIFSGTENVSPRESSDQGQKREKNRRNIRFFLRLTGGVT